MGATAGQLPPPNRRIKRRLLRGPSVALAGRPRCPLASPCLPAACWSPNPSILLLSCQPRLLPPSLLAWSSPTQRRGTPMGPRGPVFPRSPAPPPTEEAAVGTTPRIPSIPQLCWHFEETTSVGLSRILSPFFWGGGGVRGLTFLPGAFSYNPIPFGLAFVTSRSYRTPAFPHPDAGVKFLVLQEQPGASFLWSGEPEFQAGL